MNYTKKLLVATALVTLVSQLASDAHAIRLKIRQTKGDQNKVVASSGEKAGFSEKKRGVVKFSGKQAQLAIVTEDGPQSVILAYKKEGRLLSARKVLSNPSKYCSDNNIEAYTGLRGKRVNLKIQTREESDVAFYSGRLRGGNGPKKKNFNGLVEVNSDCLPAATGLNLGLGSSEDEEEGQLNINSEPLETDQDADGLLDLFDVDIDNDSILNNYDESSSFPESFPNFYVFSNLKVDIEDTININALGREPTKEEVDTLTENTRLAIEVKATGDEESELNCGTLSYCSAGGTGETGNPAVAFPGSAGGDLDSDSDGHGTIEVGSTGDFQLDTNLSEFNKINAGDSYVQSVTPSGGDLAQFYFTSLQFAFRATPALKSLTLDPDGSDLVTTFTYPVTSGDAGTAANCLTVFTNADDDIILEYEAWRPQRAGISAAGEADFMDIGNSKITIDIPNAPAPNGSTPSDGPGNCPASSYSTSDTDLSVVSDGLQDSLGDTEVDSDNTVIFRVDITDCLDSAGQSLDSGEEVSVDLQFRNDVGDNAAQKICIQVF